VAPEAPGMVNFDRKIPIPVIAVVADILATRYTHSRIDYFMEAANITCEPPGGNKVDKSRSWLKMANEITEDPLATLGKVITELMEVNSSGYASDADLDVEREKLRKVLGEHGLSYIKGGRIINAAATTVAENLQDIIANRDLVGLQTEYDRIFEHIESDPALAVTASCSLLESLFKQYIAEENLAMPTEQSIRPLWKVIRSHLNFDPAAVDDKDLRTVLTGLAAFVEGIGALRTHKGSAHGHGKPTYKLKPRHARLAAYASVTLACFVLEAWSDATAP